MLASAGMRRGWDGRREVTISSQSSLLDLLLSALHHRAHLRLGPTAFL